MTITRFAGFALLAVGLLFAGRFSHAAIIGSYAVDANTLHLWHLEDTAVPVLDAAGVATPIDLTSLGLVAGGSLGAASFNPPSFGNAYSGVNVLNTGLYAKTPANSTSDNTSTASFRNATTGAFTYELIMRADFDPTLAGASYQIISNDNDSSPRDFQFTLNYAGTGSDFFLEFTEISPSIVALDSSPFSITQGHWYHVAVTYNGSENTADNMTFYWSDMTTNASNTVATSVGTANMPADLTATASDFAVGAEARQNTSLSNPNSGQFAGLIDEVRISDIARGADQFIFGPVVPEPSSMALVVLSVVCQGSCLRRRG
jgi:hypothetical protein